MNDGKSYPELLGSGYVCLPIVIFLKYSHPRTHEARMGLTDNCEGHELQEDENVEDGGVIGDKDLAWTTAGSWGGGENWKINETKNPPINSVG